MGLEPTLEATFDARNPLEADYMFLQAKTWRNNLPGASKHLCLLHILNAILHVTTCKPYLRLDDQDQIRFSNEP